MGRVDGNGHSALKRYCRRPSPCSTESHGAGRRGRPLTARSRASLRLRFCLQAGEHVMRSVLPVKSWTQMAQGRGMRGRGTYLVGTGSLVDGARSQGLQVFEENAEALACGFVFTQPAIDVNGLDGSECSE